MRIVSYLLMIVVALLGVSFAILNAQPVPINYYFGHHLFPLSLLLVMAIGIGIFCGLIVCCGMYLRLKTDNIRLKNRIKLAEKEVENLRAIPLKDEH